MNIQLIAKKHKSFTRTIRNKFISKIDPKKTNIYFVTQQTNRMAKLLDIWTRERVEEGARAAFRKEQVETEKSLPRGSRPVLSDSMFNAINSRALNMLLLDSGIGLVHRLRWITEGLKKQVRVILAQSRLLRDMSRLTGDKDTVTIADLQRTISEFDKNSVFHNVTNFGRVGSVPVEVHVEMLLRTKVAQLRNLARRNVWLRYGHHLVRIKNVRSSKSTPCHMYIGRVFALSQAAAQQYEVPHVTALPSGGAPFHPNCKHEEILFIPGKVKKLSRPPDWAMNSKWDVVKQMYKALGAEDFAMSDNPNFRNAKDASNR